MCAVAFICVALSLHRGLLCVALSGRPPDLAVDVVALSGAIMCVVCTARCRDVVFAPPGAVMMYLHRLVPYRDVVLAPPGAIERCLHLLVPHCVSCTV